MLIRISFEAREAFDVDFEQVRSPLRGFGSFGAVQGQQKSCLICLILTIIQHSSGFESCCKRIVDFGVDPGVRTAFVDSNQATRVLI